MAPPGGKPPLIQRYRIWPLLSHNPARGQIEGLGMRRRELLLLLGGMMPAARALRAQQKAMPVIGFLGATAAIFMCVFDFRSRRKTIRCGRARARSVAVIAHAWFRTPEDYSRFGRMTGRWLKITASEPAPAIF